MIPGKKVLVDEEVLFAEDLAEEIIAYEDHSGTNMEKLPQRLRDVIRKPNWVNSYKEMLDEDPCCSSNNVLNYFCLQTVREGDLVLAWDAEKPYIFGPGMKNLSCYKGLCRRSTRLISAADNYINHGSMYIITVPQGMLGYGVELGLPVILAPGRHKIESHDFSWHGNIDLKGTMIKIGEWQLIRVDFGRVGVATIAGKMRILEQGLHLFEPPDIFLRFVNTRIQILQLPTCVQESSDYVPLLVKANISYHIKDPLKCIDKIQDQGARKIITEVSSAAISAIIRSSTLGDMAMASKKAVRGHHGEGETFHQKMHSRFMSQVGKQLLGKMGIEVANINIEQLRINDTTLANQISAQAVKISELEAQHKTLEKEGQVKRQKAQIDTDVAQARAEAEYIVIAKRAEGSKLKALAEAEAQAEAVKLQSEAEIAVYNKRSCAEAEHAERMDSSKLHRELALIKAQMDPQAKALHGVKQIAYVPHLPAILHQKGGIFASVPDFSVGPDIKTKSLK